MKKKIMTLFLAMLVTLCLSACGGGDKTSPTSEPTATTAPTATPEPTATTAPTATPEPTATTAPTATPEPTATSTPTPIPEPTLTPEEIEISTWACYAGVMGEDYIYYAFNDGGTRGGLVILSADLTQSISVFGECGVDEESGLAYIADDDSNLVMIFGVTENADGTYTIDFGDLGTALVGAAEPKAVLDAMDTIMAGTTDVTADFIASLEAAQQEQQTANTIDITGWKYYAGFVEQPGDFYGDTLFFTMNPEGTQAGMILVSATSTGACASVFGDFLYDEATGLFYIQESGTEQTAVFQMYDIGYEGYYSLDLGGLGYVTIGVQPESVAGDFTAVAAGRTTDTTDAFLAELAKITEGAVEDPEGSYYFSGTMDTGDSVYYARTMGGTNNWLIILSADQMQAVIAQGETTYDEATQTECITDLFTGYKVFYQVQKVSGGYQLIFANGAQGTATVTKCADYEVMEAMDYAFMNPENITGAFVEELNR